MPGGRHAVDDDSGDLDVGAEAGEALDERCDRLALPLGIDDQDDGQLQGRCEVAGRAGAVGGAIEEAHDALDEQQVGIGRMVGGEGLEARGAHGPGV